MRKLSLLGLITVFTLAICQSAFAFIGFEHGNGGDAVVCRNSDSSLKSVELLDFYEARMQGISQVAVAPGARYQDILDLVLNRLQTVAPMRAALYKKLVARYMSEVNLQPGIELVDIPDSNHLSFPKGCAVEQLAIIGTGQLKAINYLVNKDLWDKMDDLNRAGMILHESIYGDEALWMRSGVVGRDSTSIRALNQYIFSPQLETDSFQLRWLRFVTLRIQPIEYGGIPFRVDQVYWNSTGNVWGAVYATRGANDAYKVSVYGVQLEVGCGKAEFFKGTTNVFRMGLCANQVFIINGANVEFLGTSPYSTPITFFETGALQTGILAKATSLQFEDGSRKNVAAGTKVTFNSRGLVVRAENQTFK